MKDKELFQDLNQIAARFEMKAFSRSLTACENLISDQSKVKIAVLGRFKSGKSSFLNSILKIDILPSGVLPVTGVITSISGGRKANGKVEFLDGSNKNIELEEIGKFISEAENPDNSLSVKEVHVEHPNLSIYSGLQFVDTPGLGSTHSHNTDASMEWLPEAGAALVAIATDPPISENDLKLLKDLLHITPRIFILLTKADLLTPGELNQVQQFISTELKKHLGREFVIYPYSIKNSETEFKDRIEKELLFPLSAKSIQEVQSILNFKLHSLRKEMQSYLNIALESSLKTESERSSLKGKILGERKQIGSIEEDIHRRLIALKSRLRPNIENRYSNVQEELSTRLQADFSKEAAGWHVNLFAFSRKYEDWLDNQLGIELQRVLSADTKSNLDILDQAQKLFTDVVQGFQLRLAESIKHNLGIEFQAPKFNLEIAPPTKPNLAFIHSFSIHFDLLWFVLPMRIFRKPFERHFHNRIPGEVVKNFSRITRQWIDILEMELEKMAKNAIQTIQDEMQTVEHLLEMQQSKLPEIRDAVARLQGEITNVIN